MNPRTFEPMHLDFVDSVRGIAFLGVMFTHISLTLGAFPGQTFAGMGGYGVQLFFLASAFTLCHSMATRQKGDRLLLTSFFLRRLFRIAPMFWLAMILYWTAPLALNRFWLSQMAPEGAHTSYFVLTALFLQGWHPYTLNSIVPGGWSIAVEMTFYAVFPFCFFFLNSAKALVRSIIGCFLLSTAIYYALWPWLLVHLFGSTPDHPIPAFNALFFRRHWFFAQCEVFLVGIGIYHLLLQKTVQQRVRQRFWRHAILIVSLGLFIGGKQIAMPPVPVDIIALAGVIVAFSGETSRWLINPLLTGLGKISYSCYLLHFAALDIALRLLGIHIDASTPVFDGGRPLANLLIFCKLAAITLPLTVVFSTISYHLVEKPGIGLGRRVVRRINANRAASTSPLPL